MNLVRPASLLALLAVTAAARAELTVKVPAVPDSAISNLVRVVAPAARCAAVSDAHRLLAIGHHAKHKDAHVSLFRLENDGKPADQPIALKLPRPDGLARFGNEPLSLAFHPKLPLLYVWQDFVIPRDPQKENAPIPLTEAELAAAPLFDHLLVFNVEKEQPELLVAMCRGVEYVYNHPHGTVSVDPAAIRLYIPNLRGHPRSRQALVGSFVLEADGLPLLGKESADTPLPATVDRAAHIAAIKAESKPILPQRIAPGSHEAFNGDVASGAGFGCVHIAKDVVVFGGYHTTSLISWMPEERRVKLFSFLGSDGGYKHYFVCGHATLPLVYSAPLSTPNVYRFEHVDGLPSLLPKRAELAGAYLTSPPVMMPKANQIAIGGRQRVFLLRLDDQGRFKPERVQALIGNQDVEALVYSQKFDRLYVGVEKPK